MFFKSKRTDEEGGERPSESGMPKWMEDSPLFRQIFFEKWFRLAFIFGVLGLLVFPPAVLIRWPATPPHIKPPSKIRGLDRLQAWSMRRTARQFMDAGKFKDAVATWRLAMAANPANMDNMREFLTYVAGHEPVEFATEPLALKIASWMMDVRQTNRADFELVSNVYGRYGEYDLVLRLLTPLTNRLSAVEAARMMEAYFHRGEMELFREHWFRYPDLTNSPSAVLYHHAWEAGWGPRVMQSEARLALNAAKKDPKTEVLAHRLQLAVARVQSQPEIYAASLKELQNRRLDRYSEHVNYWVLLEATGSKAEAIRLARQFSGSPAKPSDCEIMASALSAFGLNDDALRFLERQRKEFPSYIILWMQSAQVLIKLEKWEELRSLGMSLRNSKQLRSVAQGYGYYIEALANHKLGRRNLTEESIRLALDSPLEIPFLGYTVATGFSRMGYPDPARRLFDKLESAYGNKADYWYQMQMAAYEAKDAEGMLIAAEKAFALAPEHRVTVNNLAAALLILRQRPSEALRLTLRRYTESPNDLGSIINHAMALLQNQRDAEAETFLQRINPLQLTGQLQSVLNFALFELEARRGNAEKARALAEKVDRQFLLPPQQKWLDAEVARLGGGDR